MKNGSSETSKTSSGFTLAELLIVVAIIGVLVAISIPIFHAQMEKARRAVDMHTARSIESVLTAAYNMGRIQLPQSADPSSTQGNSIAVIICRDSSSIPNGYNTSMFQNGRNPSCFCIADGGVIVDGVRSSNWKTYNTKIADILTESGLDPATLCSRSDGKEGGWDWVVILVGMTKNKNGSVFTRIYSGKKGSDGGYFGSTNQYPTNIEKLMYGVK